MLMKTLIVNKFAPSPHSDLFEASLKSVVQFISDTPEDYSIFLEIVE